MGFVSKVSGKSGFRIQLSGTAATCRVIVESEGGFRHADRIPDHQVATLKAIAAARGLTLNAWLGKLAEEATELPVRKPLKTGRGMFAKCGPAPSAEEIDQNRHEMFKNFAQDI
jgi:hypothetical protein